MADEYPDNDAGVSDGMADAMGGSTLAFMSMTVLVMVALLAILLLFALKVQEADLSKTKEAQLTQRIERLEQELATARAAARAASAAFGAGGIHVKAGYEFWVNPSEEESYLTDPRKNKDDCEQEIHYVCRPRRSYDIDKLVCDDKGGFNSKGVVPR